MVNRFLSRGHEVFPRPVDGQNLSPRALKELRPPYPEGVGALQFLADSLRGRNLLAAVPRTMDPGHWSASKVQRVKVLLVDNSSAIRETFGPLLDAAPGVHVIGYAEEGPIRDFDSLLSHERMLSLSPFS